MCCVRGSTMIDVLIAVALFGIFFGGFLSLAQLGIKTAAIHKARAGALALTRARIEYVRSLEYAAVGVVGGNPSGVLAAETLDELNGVPYTLTTDVRWRDDPADGVTPADTQPHDYKALSVEATWQSTRGAESLTLSSYVADFTTE